MIKNPYAKLNQTFSLDERGEAIIKKARAYGVEVYENPTICKELLRVDGGVDGDGLYEFFIWILQQEKDAQMSS